MAPGFHAPWFGGIQSVFLDRDGVLNRKAREGKYISTWAEFIPLAGVESAIARLNASGRKVFVVTNQRGIALGLYSEADVRALHERFDQHLAAWGAHIDGWFFCPHDRPYDRSGCRCRKPLPGLFEQAFAANPGTGPESSVMIGDSLSDIQAGRALGMRTIFIDSGSKSSKPGGDQAMEFADATCSSLAAAVDACLAG